MNKVIKIAGADYRVEHNTGVVSTCRQCTFYSGECPNVTGDRDILLCTTFGDTAFFVAESAKPLVEEFKEAAGITTECTFTEAEVLAAYKDWLDDDDDEAESFVAHLKKFSDPEYKEFLRLKAKFSE